MTANLVRIIKRMIEQVRFAISGPRAKLNRIDRFITQDGFQHLGLSNYVSKDAVNLTPRSVNIIASTFLERDRITELPFREEPSDEYIHQLGDPWLGSAAEVNVVLPENRDSILVTQFRSTWKLKFIKLISAGMPLEFSDNCENPNAVWDGWKYDFWPYIKPQFEDPEELVNSLFVGPSGFLIAPLNRDKLDFNEHELEHILSFCAITLKKSSFAYRFLHSQKI